MKCYVIVIVNVLVFFFEGIQADITLLEKYSHKTHYSLEQMISKSDCILEVKKSDPFENKLPIASNKKDRCPPYMMSYFNFYVKDIIKGDSLVKKGMKIKVKEPFSDIAYTVHYSFYTKGFVIEPFIGQYYPEIKMSSTDELLIFLNTYRSESGERKYQFCIIDAFESVSKTGEIIKIIKRPPADMKRLFLKSNGSVSNK